MSETQCQRHKEHFDDKVAKRSVYTVIKTLESQLSFIEQEIKELLDKDDELKAKAKVIKSVKSVGEKTIITSLYNSVL